eukprot:4532098-Pleurochrysis_carterae.AAC.2
MARKSNKQRPDSSLSHYRSEFCVFGSFKDLRSHVLLLFWHPARPSPPFFPPRSPPPSASYLIADHLPSPLIGARTPTSSDPPVSL